MSARPTPERLAEIDALQEERDNVIRAAHTLTYHAHVVSRPGGDAISVRTGDFLALCTVLTLVREDALNSGDGTYRP